MDIYDIIYSSPRARLEEEFRWSERAFPFVELFTDYRDNGHGNLEGRSYCALKPNNDQVLSPYTFKRFTFFLHLLFFFVLVRFLPLHRLILSLVHRLKRFGRTLKKRVKSPWNHRFPDETWIKRIAARPRESPRCFFSFFKGTLFRE